MHSEHKGGYLVAGEKRPVTTALHRRVFLIVVGLAVWFVLSIWLFASTTGEVNYLLFIVSGFICVAVGLPFILSQVKRSDNTTAEIDNRQTYRDWATSEFDTSQGRLGGHAAAAQILLPIAAVAIGMTIFGVALHVAEHEGPQQSLASHSSSRGVRNNG